MSMQLGLFNKGHSTTTKRRKIVFTEEIKGNLLTVGYAFFTYDDLISFRTEVEQTILEKYNGVCVFVPLAEAKED